MFCASRVALLRWASSSAWLAWSFFFASSAARLACWSRTRSPLYCSVSVPICSCSFSTRLASFLSVGWGSAAAEPVGMHHRRAATTAPRIVSRRRPVTNRAGEKGRPSSRMRSRGRMREPARGRACLPVDLCPRSRVPFTKQSSFQRRLPGRLTESGRSGPTDRAYSDSPLDLAGARLLRGGGLGVKPHGWHRSRTLVHPRVALNQNRYIRLTEHCGSEPEGSRRRRHNVSTSPAGCVPGLLSFHRTLKFHEPGRATRAGATRDTGRRAR